MKVIVIRPEYVKQFPEQLIEGILYVSEEFELTAHKCCCGCGEDVYNKLSPVKWCLSKSSDGSVSLYPSIGNWKYQCKSHYWIRNNQIIEAGTMSVKEIEMGQIRDRQDRDRYIAQINSQAESKLSIKIWRSIRSVIRRILQYLKIMLRIK